MTHGRIFRRGFAIGVILVAAIGLIGLWHGDALAGVPAEDYATALLPVAVAALVAGLVVGTVAVLVARLRQRGSHSK